MSKLLWLFIGSQAILEFALIICLASTHWTSWNLRIQWTSTDRNSNKDYAVVGELESSGHAGLWSRCSRIVQRSVNLTSVTNWTTSVKSDECLSNFEDYPSDQQYSYGKVCKKATAGLCTLATCLTFVIVVVASVKCYRQNKCRRFGTSSITCRLRNVILCLLPLQGVALVMIPVIYLSGNMSEMIENISKAYVYLRVVAVFTVYHHTWATWLQVSSSFLWILSTMLFCLTETRATQNEDFLQVKTSESTDKSTSGS